MTASNVVFACAQIGLLVLVCAPLPRLLGLRAPVVQYLFWRGLLVACLLLPFVQPRQQDVMQFVPAPAGVALLPPGTDAPPALAVPPAPAAIDWWTVAGLVIAAGFMLRLAWIVAGILRLERMRRRADEAVTGFDDLSRTVGVNAPILWSRDVTHPVTFGVLRPLVLLPMALKSADAAAQRAVVAHELYHVKRRDWLWVVAEEVVRSLLWFHPAVWWLISRVQLAREIVVDELSILTTNARRAYLDTLLAFADDTGLQSTPAFSARRHLFHRVMLLSKEGGMSSIRIAVSSCVLAVALGAGSFAVVRAFPLHELSQLPPPPPPPPPKDPISAEAYKHLGVLNLERVRVDSSLTDQQKLELILEGIAAENRALGIEPNYAGAMVWKSLLLRTQARLSADSVEQSVLINEADALRQEAITLQQSGREYVDRDAKMGPPPPPPPPPPAGRGVSGAQEQMVFVPAQSTVLGSRLVTDMNPVRVGEAVAQPAQIRDVKPIYPPLAKEAGVSGAVVVDLLIDQDGNVAVARVMRSIPLLDQAALDAVRQWKFAPTHVDGVPRAVMMTASINFRRQ